MPRPGGLSSQKLKNCFLREFKRATELTESQRAIRTEYFTGYQAHHIVPVEIIRNVINPRAYPDASWEDIAYNATEFIRMVLDHATVEQRRKHKQIDLDQFADIYLWPVYAE